MGLTISGTQTVGVHLTSASQNPVSVTSTGAIITTGSYAIYGSAVTAWSITNHGTLSAANTNTGFGRYYYGIELTGGGSITNGSASDTTALIFAYISGSQGHYSRGVFISGCGTVTNYGRISSGDFGVLIESGGSLINGSASDTTASISTLQRGIGISPGTVINFGTIDSKFSDGVYRSEGSVTNGSSSDTGALIRGGNSAVSLSGTLTNYGTIVGGYYGASLSSNYGPTYGETVTNGSVGDTAAVISGGGSAPGRNLSIGINERALVGTVTNFATIEGGFYGVRIVQDGTLTNGSGGDATAAISGGFDGVLMTGGTGTVNNYGTIVGKGARGIGGIGVYFNPHYPRKDHTATLTNAGTIIGGSGTAVWFKGGSDRLIVDPSAVFVGDVKASGTGVNTLELAKGAGVGTIAGIGTSFVHFRHLQLDQGARWVLAGSNSLSGGSLLSLRGGVPLSAAGTLDVGGDLAMSTNGTLAMRASGAVEVGGTSHLKAGRLVIDGGHTLSGTGTINGAVTDSGVILAHGGSLAFGGNASGHGVIGAGAVEIDTGALLLARNDLRVQHAVFLAGTHETLVLGSPGKMTATISGFGTTDTIDLLNITATGSFANGILTLTGPHGGHAALHFAGSYASGFTIGSDGHGGTAITVHA